ncbi:MAG: Lrp/AsnC family transcriptional regulator [Pseudomonadota bacterium]
MITLDATDRALIALLKRDARASVTELAARADLSRVTVAARLKALKERGIIRRYTVELSTPVEEEVVQATSLMELDLSKADRVHRALRRMPEVVALNTTNGKWALVVQHETANLAAFDALLGKIGKLDGVVNVETCLHLTRLI